MRKRVIFYRTAKVIAILSLCLTFFRCGYSLRGTGSFLPPSIKKISIPLFKNLTTRFELDIKLTQGVVNEFAARGKVEVTQDNQNADAVLSGDILVFNVTPVAFSGEARADRYTITVAARIVLKDSKTQKVYFSNPYLSYQEEYAVPPGSDFEASETDAITKVAENFARTLVTNILEGF